jgi:flavin-dependent dehydrogenase
MAVLQEALLNKAVQCGAEIMTGCLAIGAENQKRGVLVTIKHRGRVSVLAAARLIAADGLNSRLAETMGLNKARPVIVKGPVLETVYQGAELPHPPGFAFILGNDMKGGDGFLFVYPHAAVENACAVMVNCRFPADQCLDRIEHFTKKSKFAVWFRNARLIHRTAAVVTVRPPSAQPVIGHVLFIGDAPAYGETLVAGAMFCGFHAADAVYRELAGKNGFAWYCDLWASKFDFVANPQRQKDYTKILRLYGSLPDADLDFLFRLSQEHGPINIAGQAETANEYSGGNIMIDYFLGFPQVQGRLRTALQEMRNS